MSYYQRHVFFCCNKRDNGARCCADNGAQDVRDYAKSRVKELKLSGEGKTRINSAGCLDRCADQLMQLLRLGGVQAWRWHAPTERDELRMVRVDLVQVAPKPAVG